jgi:PAS domain S-box-containing protein
MTDKKPTDIIHYRQTGWLELGHNRMMLFDILHGYYSLRKVIKDEVGDNESYLVFQAGIKGGFFFLEPMIRKGRIEAGPRGFSESLSRYTDGGAGDFQIKEMDWQKGWARIACESSFEAWSFHRKRSKIDKPACHYNRGIILGFMKATHRYSGTGLEHDLDCVEIACLATGRDRCEFIVGTKDQIRSRGYEASAPRKSIQQQLKERVEEKTREIREADRFNEMILNNAPVGILTLNTEGEVVSANPSIAGIIGIPHRRLIGKSLVGDGKIISLDLSDHLRRGLKGEHFDLIDYPFTDMRRGRRFLAVKGIPLKRTRGPIEGLLCIVEDTTQETLNTRRIDYLKTYNENIIQSMTEGIMVLDPFLEIQTWNRKMEEIFHLKAGRVLGKKLVNVAPPFSESKLADTFESVIREGLQVEEKGFQFVTSGYGTMTLNLKIIPLFDERSHVSGIIVLCEDITDREKIEVRYRNLFETAQDGICLTDLNGRLISANRKVFKVLETDWESLHMASLDRFLPPDKKSKLQESLTLAIEGHEIEPYELELISTSGKLTPVELSITAVKNKDKVFGLQIISRDIAKRKKMEKQVIQASKLAAVGELASGVAHEINNPLASVAGYAEELMDLIHENGTLRVEDLDEFKEGLGIIIEQAHRCKEITQNLLDMARQGEVTLTPIRLNDLIEKTLLLIDRDLKQSNTVISKDLDPRLPLAETDPAQLQQVFLNILKNALEAVGRGGVIRVSSRSESGSIWIRFQDNGCGISNEKLKDIFNPFFTTKPSGSGTGLGLSICYNIMEKLKGTIEVESRRGEGSIFTVNVPLTWNGTKGERMFI